MNNKINDLQEELLKSTKELNAEIKNIIKNGTIEQKVELLANDYLQRLVIEESRKEQEIQMQLLRSSLGFYDPIRLLANPEKVKEE